MATSRARVSQALVALAAAGGVGTLLRRRRGERQPAPPPPAPPPMTTQSSPGQIADLQQEFGADMAPPSVDGRPDPV
jgi:hypothetical protein